VGTRGDSAARPAPCRSIPCPGGEDRVLPVDCTRSHRWQIYQGRWPLRQNNLEQEKNDPRSGKASRPVLFFSSAGWISRAHTGDIFRRNRATASSNIFMWPARRAAFEGLPRGSWSRQPWKLPPQELRRGVAAGSTTAARSAGLEKSYSESRLYPGRAEEPHPPGGRKLDQICGRKTELPLRGRAHAQGPPPKKFMGSDGAAPPAARRRALPISSWAGAGRRRDFRLLAPGARP